MSRIRHGKNGEEEVAVGLSLAGGEADLLLVFTIIGVLILLRDEW